VAPARAVDAPPLEAAAPGRAAGRRGRRGPGQRAGRHGRHPLVGRRSARPSPASSSSSARRQGGQGHEPVQGHRLCDGVARRAHPRTHPGNRPSASSANRQRQLVLSATSSLRRGRRGRPPARVALGRDIAGRACWSTWQRCPRAHLGATGAGNPRASTRSSLVLMRARRPGGMILVDPKRVELGQYNGCPTPHRCGRPEEGGQRPRLGVKEMERRYDLLAEYGVRDITASTRRTTAATSAALEPSVRQQVQAVADKVKREAGPVRRRGGRRRRHRRARRGRELGERLRSSSSSSTSSTT